MKKTICTICMAIAMLFCGKASAQVKYVYTEASDLTLIGKLMDTPNPYQRVDTVKYKGFTAEENKLVRMSSGIAVVFRTDSKFISVKTDFGYKSYQTNTSGFAARGYDLYIKKDGDWLWAASGCPSLNKEDKNMVLIKNMAEGVKECLMYLPLFSEEYSVKIGVEEGSMIEAAPSPFRHRVGIFGSSYTHGSSTSRSGMSYPAQFTRSTGIQLLSLGVSGNSKLQPYFADVLADADVDAYIFDAFSNPSAKEIKERLFPFIERMNAAHPGKPMIFQKTIRREKRNFDTVSEKSEQGKIDMADSLMKIAVKRYPDVYYIDCTNATSAKHDASVDGVHPTNYGYTLWEQSIEKPVLKILRKYGIR